MSVIESFSQFDTRDVVRELNQQWNRRLRLSPRSILDHYLNGEGVIHLYAQFWRASVGSGGAVTAKMCLGVESNQQLVFVGRRDMVQVLLPTSDQLDCSRNNATYFSLKRGFGSWCFGDPVADGEFIRPGPFVLTVCQNQLPDDMVETGPHMFVQTVFTNASIACTFNVPSHLDCEILDMFVGPFELFPHQCERME